MSMEWKVSERDKKLLVGLAVFLVFFGMIRLVILPLGAENRELKQQIQNEEELKEVYEIKAAQLAQMKADRAGAFAGLEEVRERYYPIMTQTQIDQAVTLPAVELGLVPRDLSITASDGKESSISTYAGSAQKENTVTVKGLETAVVVLKLRGQSSKLWQYLDDCIQDYPRKRVVSYLFEGDAAAGGSTGLTVTMELYMCEDIQEYQNREQGDAAQEKNDEAAAAGQEMIDGLFD